MIREQDCMQGAHLMKKHSLPLRILFAAAIFFLLAAGLILGLKYRHIRINRLFISDDDIIGVDLSRYQVNVDMNRLAEQNVRFVYIKATEGSDYIDPYFHENWKNAKASPMAYGAYHFFSFDSPGELQAENYIENAGDLRGALFPVVDVELYGSKWEHPPKKADVVRELHSFIRSIKDEYGVEPIIYTGRPFYSKYLKDDFDSCLFWPRSVFYPAKLDGWDNWAIWQYSDRGLFDGHGGGREKYIDLDVLNRNLTLEDLTVR